MLVPRPSANGGEAGGSYGGPGGRAVSEAGRRLIAAHAPAGAAVFAEIEAAFGKARMEALLDLLEALQRIAHTGRALVRAQPKQNQVNADSPEG
jgi:hypothetical protein